jgi:hypothetical protein
LSEAPNVARRVAAGPQPHRDPPEQGAELLPRYVIQDVEPDHSVERRRFELESNEVRLDEAARRNALARAPHLLGRDVDADEPSPFRQDPRRAHAGT